MLMELVERQGPRFRQLSATMALAEAKSKPTARMVYDYLVLDLTEVRLREVLALWHGNAVYQTTRTWVRMGFAQAASELSALEAQRLRS